MWGAALLQSGDRREAAVASNPKPRPGLGPRAAVRPLQSPVQAGTLGHISKYTFQSVVTCEEFSKNILRTKARNG